MTTHVMMSVKYLPNLWTADKAQKIAREHSKYNDQKHTAVQRNICLCWHSVQSPRQFSEGQFTPLDADIDGFMIQRVLSLNDAGTTVSNKPGLIPVNAPGLLQKNKSKPITCTDLYSPNKVAILTTANKERTNRTSTSYTLATRIQFKNT